MKSTLIRYLVNNEQQSNDNKQSKDNDNYNLDEELEIVNSVSSVLLYVLIAISSIIVLAIVIFLIKLCYSRYKKSDYMKKELDSRSALSQAESESKNIVEKMSNQSVSINQDNFKCDKTQKEILIQQQNKEISAIDIQHISQLDINNIQDIKKIIGNIDIQKEVSSNLNNISIQKEQLFDDKNDSLAIEQEEKAQETYDTSLFNINYNSQQASIMTPSFSNNYSFNSFQVKGSEKNIITQTEETMKTIESNYFCNKVHMQNFKKKSLFEYNNQLSQNNLLNHSLRIKNNLQNNFASQQAGNQKNSIQYFSNLQPISEDQKQQQLKPQMNNVNKNSLQFQNLTFDFQKYKQLFQQNKMHDSNQQSQNNKQFLQKQNVKQKIFSNSKQDQYQQQQVSNQNISKDKENQYPIYKLN